MEQQSSTLPPKRVRGAVKPFRTTVSLTAADLELSWRLADRLRIPRHEVMIRSMRALDRILMAIDRGNEVVIEPFHGGWKETIDEDWMFGERQT